MPLPTICEHRFPFLVTNRLRLDRRAVHPYRERLLWSDCIDDLRRLLLYPILTRADPVPQGTSGADGRPHSLQLV